MQSSRQLKRHETPTEDIEIGQRLCVKGGLSDDWLVLPVEKQSGTLCVRITATTCAWLNQSCFALKTSTHDSRKVIQWAMDHCRQRISHTSVSSQSINEDLGADAQAVLADGSDDDEDAEVDDAPATPRVMKCPSVWSCIVTDKGPITVLPAKSCNKLFVKCTSDDIKTFLSLVASFKSLRKESHGRVLFPSGEFSGGLVPEAYLKPSDKGKIDFDFRAQTWRVSFKSCQGHRKRRTETKGLGVSSTRADGTTMDSEEFVSALKSRLVKARKLWNVLDQSADCRLSDV